MNMANNDKWEVIEIIPGGGFAKVAAGSAAECDRIAGELRASGREINIVRSGWQNRGYQGRKSLKVRKVRFS